MQKGQFFLPSRGVPPPLLRAKNVTGQQFYKGTFAKKKRLFFGFVFAGYPVFLVYTLFKIKYHSAGTGSMLRGVQRYDNDSDFLVYTLLKTK